MSSGAQLVDADGAWTHDELNRHACGIAEELLAIPAPTERIVALLLPRTKHVVAAMYGAWAAGGAYVPIDPTFPEARIEHMLVDSRASAVVTVERWRAKVAASGLPVIDVETVEPAASRPIAPPAALAYLMYTSGSTGKPKAVRVPHSALTNLVEAMRTTLEFRSSDVMLALTNWSFDIAALEIFVPLTSSAKTVIAKEGESVDARRIEALIAAHGVTCMQATPSTYRLLLAQKIAFPPSVRLFCGGEALDAVTAEALLAQGVRLWNLYGPTETTVWSTAKELHVPVGRVTVGKPIANTRVYVLDEALKPAAEGELAISGDGVAEGYHHQPALTAARFVPDPFWTGKRMYLTGDRARLMANGEVDLLGRLDDQVKIRGHRIELGDVEATLLTHGAIASAACVVVGDEAEKRIIACVAAKPGVAPDEAALQTFLRGALPEAYRPARVLVLDALPLNSSQKIDRPALKTLVTTLL